MVTRCQSAVASQPPPWTTGASSRRGRCGKLWDTGLKSPRPSRESGVPTLPAEGCGRGDGLSGHMHLAGEHRHGRPGRRESYRQRDADGARWREAGGSCPVQDGPAAAAAVRSEPTADRALG